MCFWWNVTRQVAGYRLSVRVLWDFILVLELKMTKSSGVSEHRQNVWYFSVLLSPVVAVHCPLLSPGSTVSWHQIEWQLEYPWTKIKLFPSWRGREEGRCIPLSPVLTWKEHRYVDLTVTQIAQGGMKSVWAEIAQRIPATASLKLESCFRSLSQYPGLELGSPRSCLPPTFWAEGGRKCWEKIGPCS